MIVWKDCRKYEKDERSCFHYDIESQKDTLIIHDGVCKCTKCGAKFKLTNSYDWNNLEASLVYIYGLINNIKFEAAVKELDEFYINKITDYYDALEKLTELKSAAEEIKESPSKPHNIPFPQTSSNNLFSNLNKLFDGIGPANPMCYMPPTSQFDPEAAADINKPDNDETPEEYNNMEDK